METDELITEFVNREKAITHNPYLATRIMQNLTAPQRKTVGVLRYAAIAACVSTLVVLGMTIENSLSAAPREYTALNINDSEMENFAIYNSNYNEKE
jgi:hypothetical protein